MGWSGKFGGVLRGALNRVARALRGAAPAEPAAAPVARVARERVDHILLLDGTMGSLKPGEETSIGRLYHYLRAANPRSSVYYGKGLQWREWRELSDVMLGWGVNRQILRAYGWLSTRYRPGDRIFLIGYSRGAFAARSLAGIVDRVGLLRNDCATERNVLLAWRYYEAAERRPAATAFRRRFCHDAAPIEMVGVFDTVMALGLQLPFMWLLTEPRYRFHDHRLGATVNHGYQALALDETRSVLEPLIWDSEGTGARRIEQVWFRGCHGDIGGQLLSKEEARPLANIPLTWMLERAEALGLALPPGWHADFPCDPGAPSVGSWRGWGKFYLFRAPRLVGRDTSERIHESVLGARRNWRIVIRPWLARRDKRAELLRRAEDEAGGGSGRVEPPVLAAADLTTGDAG
ncbi:MAG: DUF2235 domain-containing protein [Rhodobacteraceae bacterium]|jgi:uncharacterized protein (DUF2235 family)|nr:DUF2235 domain-containing protein [Paracoccaceae bacterium]